MMTGEPKTPLSPEARKHRDEMWKQSARGQEIAAQRHEAPRPLTVEELKLLEVVLERGSKESKLFLPQIREMRAVRWCDCGCPSIRLVTDPNVPRVDMKIGNIVCDLEGTTAENERAGVLLFQKNGRLDLMEIYSLDAGCYGETPEYGLPRVESLVF